jgi:hypothetical protein
LFTLPDQGAGGTFAGGSHTLTVITDKAGRAVAHGFRPNAIEGQYQIHVSASYQGETATANVGQGNSAAAGSAAATAGGHGKLIAILVAGAAAIAGGVIAATRGGGQSTPVSTSTTVAPGTGTVGPPR